ncbi:MAG: SDR family NAD(P)-dependent oxidoreductase, partial [Methanobacteriota archaeon]
MAEPPWTVPMDGKVCVVTGATGALGGATAVGLAKQGATVVLVARDRGRGDVARAHAREASGGASFELEVADLSSLAYVRDLARRIRSTHPRLDVLVNIAAVYKQERTVTADGLETMFATNNLG